MNKNEQPCNRDMDNQKVMVAIRCITYNHEPYIRDALEGFVMQKTNFPFVAIVHDDASTDGTAAIIKEYAEKYPDIIKPIYETENQYSKRDGSLTRIMKEACEATGAKYIAMCEGDDYWTDPLKLQKQVDFLESHPDYGMCYTDFDGYDVDKDQRREMNIKDFSGNLYEMILNEIHNIWTLTVCYRSEYMNQIPLLDYNRYFVGDRVWFLTIASKSKIHCIYEKTAIYRILKDSASHFVDIKKRSTFRTLCCRTNNYFLENGIPVSEKTWNNVKRNLSKALISQSYYCNQKELLNEAHFPLSLITNVKDLLFYIFQYGKKSEILYLLLRKIVVILQ